MTIVVYDGSGLFSAPRVWWTFRVFGAPSVFVLDGGFPAWKAEGRPVETAVPAPRPARFAAKLDRAQVIGLEDVRAALDSSKIQVVDARSAARFRGEAPEPRPGVRSGHMPGSINMPFTNMLNQGRLANPAKILSNLASAGIDVSKPIITSCGSGVSAAILALALASVGKPAAGIYDGS